MIVENVLPKGAGLMEDFEATTRRRMDSLNDTRSGRSFRWWRLKDAEIRPEGFIRRTGKTGPDEKLGDVFISAPVFERRESTDRSRDVIVHSGIENRPLPREDVATVISRICKIEDDSDILAIVGEYGPLRIDAEWKNFMNIWRWRCDTPQEWRELSVLVNEVFYLLRAIERKLPDIDAARSRLIDILSEHVNEANVRTYYSVLPSGDIASTSGVAFDLHAAIWKVLESTVVSSKATEHLRLRECHYCGEWDFEKGGEGGRRIRQRSDKAFWYHDGCWRNEEKRLKDAARAEMEGRKRKSRPGARRKSPLD